MIITLIGADFSKNNIGTLTTWSIGYSTNISASITADSNNPSSVDRTTNTGFTATYTINDGYELSSTGVTVTMDGVVQDNVVTINGSKITVAFTSVTGNVNISINTKVISSTEPSVTLYTFTINPTPSNAIVTLTASGYTQNGSSITVPNGTTVSWSVDASGYTKQTGTWTAHGANENKSVILSAIVVDGSTTWYVDHRNNISKFDASVNIAGRGWTHVPGTDVYNAYVGKPVNTIGFFTNKASQNVTISKVTEKGDESTMTEIATVTLTNSSGATKAFCSTTFPTVTLADGECLAVYTQTDSDIQFFYLSNGGPVIDANGIVDGNFYGRVPKVYVSGIAWTNYSDALCLGMSVGYNSGVA